jgi:hypothetical protein
MTALRFRHLIGFALAAGLSADAVVWVPPVPPPVRPSAPAAGFIQDRCLLLEHHRRQLETEASRLADEELAPIFSGMNDRVDAFADWAFRWRTSYSFLRRMVLGGLSAAVHGESLPDRVFEERDAMVEDSFRTIVVRDADEQILAASERWRERLARSIAEVEHDHQTAVAMYLEFEPALGASYPWAFLPQQGESIKAGDSARDFATTRLARPALVRGGTRAGAAVLPDAIVGTSLLASSPAAVIGLLGLDYLASLIDNWVSRDGFVFDIRAALADVRTLTRERWMAVGRREIARILDARREQLAAIAGPAGCPSFSPVPAVETDTAP